MKIKIAIGIPTNRKIKPKTAFSVLNLISSSSNNIFSIVSERGFNTSENRNWIATKAVNSNCDYLFFIDDDMIIPLNTLDILLSRNKDIVGGVYKTKYEVQEDVVEYLNEERPKGFFQVKAIGTGCLLIKCDVFKKIPQHYKNTQGWFNYIWNDNGSVKMSHDWLFCYNARELGLEVWADNSLEIKHIGSKEY